MKKYQDMTPEEMELARQTLAEVSTQIVEVFNKVFAALTQSLKPIMDFYESLPDDVKQEIARVSVEGEINAEKTIH
jgi:hypothetical protein